MKKKYFFVILFLILAIFLNGCIGIVTPTTNEVKIRGVISEYFSAINNRDWYRAKSCCVYGSDRYYATCVLEQYVNSLAYYWPITITCIFRISSVSIYSNHAQAYINLTLYISYGPFSESETGSFYYYLQRVGNSWKIYS